MRIPLKYILRSSSSRRLTTVLTILGIALVVLALFWAGAWVASGAVGVDEAGDRPPAAVVGDGPVGYRRADSPVPGLPLGAGVRWVGHI